MIPITTLFLDIGGVLLTNGWDHCARKQATTNFKLDTAQVPAEQVVYIEDHPMFVRVVVRVIHTDEE